MKKITKWFRQCTSSQDQPPSNMRPGEHPKGSGVLKVPNNIEISKPPELQGNEKYHVFLSHASEDINVSEQLRDKLEEYNFTVIHSDRDFMPGTNIFQTTATAIKESKRVIMIVSKNMMSSSLVEFGFANSTTKAVEKDELIFIPVLYELSPDDVPPYVKESNCYLEMKQTNFWSKLFHLLTDKIRLHASIQSGNVAHGIAWSHYYGYLSQVLPGIKERALTSEYAKNNDIRILPKLITILPKTCNCPEKLTDLDENIQNVGEIQFNASRAGKLDRSYKTTVYKVTDPDDSSKEYYGLLECPMTLSVLYAMQMGRISNMNQAEKERQASLFREKMEQITKHPSIPQCHNRALFISYDDSLDNREEKLSRVLVKLIRTELQKMDEVGSTLVTSPTEDTAPVTELSENTSDTYQPPDGNTVSDCPALQPVPQDIRTDIKFPELPKDNYHVFISANDEDKELARHLASELERIQGMTCFYPDRDAMPGSSKFASKMDQCSKVIALVSEKYFMDNWSTFEHINTISKTCEDGWKVTIPILHNIDAEYVPPYIREVSYLETSCSDFWQRLVKALQLDRIPLSAAIPTTNIANGLAWAYYYNYLGIILPGLRKRIEDSEYNKDKDIKVLPKFILLLPKSGYCAKRFTDVDSNITYEKKRLEFRRTTSGSVRRDYGNSVLKIKDPDDDTKEYYIVMEYATPMWTMYEMEMGRLAGLSPQEKRRQMDDFTEKIKEILNDERSGDCHDLFIIVDYNDQDPEAKRDPHHLSHKVVARVRQELDTLQATTQG